MHRFVLLVMGVYVTLLATAPSSASPCEDQIRLIEARVSDAATRASALSGGGEAVAASRQAQAMQAESPAQPPAGAVQKLPEHDIGATAAVTPLAGGDKAMRAKAALERARNLTGRAMAPVARRLWPRRAASSAPLNSAAPPFPRALQRCRLQRHVERPPEALSRGHVT